MSSATAPRINLPQRMIDYVLSVAHLHIVESPFDIGELNEARTHQFRTLRLRLWQPHPGALLLLSLLPPLLGRGVRGRYRNVKMRFVPARRTN